jgi:hypothetical protein
MMSDLLEYAAHDGLMVFEKDGCLIIEDPRPYEPSIPELSFPADVPRLGRFQRCALSSAISSRNSSSTSGLGCSMSSLPFFPISRSLSGVGLN